LLLIELSTRRRLRINGHADADGPDRFLLLVDHAYANCPKYIQRRAKVGDGAVAARDVAGPRRGTALSAQQAALAAAADTIFVASLHPGAGADASHRGGRPGFITVLGPSTLRIPDYAGNSMFNTLGNFAVHPAAGLLIPDFAADRTLQLSGEAEVRWDLGDPAGATGGTGRFWDFHVTRTLELPLPVALRWDLLEPSPFNP
jgi:predicted pyridoxine 5'-phosphate oxidase superfamily flavin-nucleotide-binding protein